MPIENIIHIYFLFLSINTVLVGLLFSYHCTHLNGRLIAKDYLVGLMLALMSVVGTILLMVTTLICIWDTE